MVREGVVLLRIEHLEQRAHTARVALARRRDVIAISDLRLDCIVGIYAHERRRAQPLAHCSAGPTRAAVARALHEQPRRVFASGCWLLAACFSQ